MRAHIIDQAGLILNTVVVNSLDDIPGCIDASIGGGPGDSIINGELVPAPVVVPVPTSVTARQAVEALIRYGIDEEDVDLAIAAIQDPVQRKLARNFWVRSNEFERANPYLNTLGAALGLTTEQIDALFITAAGL